MAKSTITAKPKKKPRGRPATGRDPMYGLRMSPELVTLVDGFGSDQKPPMSRSEAMRELIRLGLQKAKRG